MSSTFAQLNDRVYLELSMAAEFLQLDVIHNAVIQAHTLRVAQSRNSSINVLLGVTAGFTPTTKRHDITALIGKGIPAWIEFQEGSDWTPMRVVNLAQIADYEQLGIQAAAFEAEESGSSTTEPIQYVNFSLTPSETFRIRFDRDTYRLNLSENILLPDSVAGLIVKEAENSIIPKIKMSIDTRCRNDKALAQIAKGLKESLSEVYAQNTLEIRDLKRVWHVWAFRDRRGDVAFTKPTPSSRGMYGY